MGSEKLTEGQMQILQRASDDAGGIAGSDVYSWRSLGNRGSCRALNRRGLLRKVALYGADYRITDLGRAALSPAGQGGRDE